MYAMKDCKARRPRDLHWMLCIKTPVLQGHFWRENDSDVGIEQTKCQRKILSVLYISSICNCFTNKVDIILAKYFQKVFPCYWNKGILKYGVDKWDFMKYLERETVVLFKVQSRVLFCLKVGSSISPISRNTLPNKSLFKNC